MNQLNSLNNIASYLARFIYTVKGLNAVNQFGINYLSETVLIPIFKEVYGYDDLRNLNADFNNTAGIDLGDVESKVAFQITSSTDNDKINHTLTQFVKYKHYEKYENLYVYIISEKNNNYSDKGYSDTIKDKFYFSKENILDYRDLLKKINDITDYDKVKRIELLLQKQFSNDNIEIYKQKFNLPENLEEIYTNLIEISFPEQFYIADIALNKKELIKEYGLNRNAQYREVIFAYKKHNNLRFAADWIDYSKKIITFQNLHDNTNDLSKIVDLGTIDTISPNEFYGQNEDCKRAFKALLKFCFAKQAHHLNILFNHDENLFIFSPINNDAVTRSEKWHSGKKSATRDVIRVKIGKDNNPWYYTHLAFRVGFKNFDNKWYLEITPDLYISKDGTKKYFQSNKVITFLKQKQYNQHVFNDLKFILYFFRYSHSQTNIFNANGYQETLKFDDLMSFSNAFKINELEWTDCESQEDLKQIKDKDGVLPLLF